MYFSRICKDWNSAKCLETGALSLLYLACLVAANILADVIIDMHVIQFAAGTLFFGALFTLRDHIHLSAGKRFVYVIIGIGFVIMTVLSFAQQLEIRIIIASLVGLVLSEITDTEVFSLFVKEKVKRVVVSNSVSIPLDTVLFTLLAFSWVWDVTLIVSVIIGDIFIKFLISFLLLLVRK